MQLKQREMNREKDRKREQDEKQANGKSGRLTAEVIYGSM